MTELMPRPAALRRRSSSSTWSRCSATGTVAISAIVAAAAATGPSLPWWKRTAFSLICRITGEWTRSAPSTTASACSSVMMLKAPTARWCTAARSTSSRVTTRVMATVPRLA